MGQDTKQALIIFTFIITDADKICVNFLLTQILYRIPDVYWCHQSIGGKQMVFKKAAVQVLLLLAGIAMLIFGIWREEAQTVFSKAIRLCMECVGIG